MADDPYRSLAWRLREAGFFRKVDVPFSEFKLANLFRALVTIGNTEASFNQAVQSAESSYAAGRTDFTMVLDSARELRMHELDLATHLAGYEQRVAELQRAVGGDLGLEQAAEAGHEEHH